MKLKALTSVIAGTAITSAVAVMLPAEPAAAALQFCNNTGSTITTSVGYYESGRWWAEGWWTIYPGDCKTVLGGSLDQRYYYYHAYTTSGDRVWEGNHYFCVSSNAFKVADSDRCGERSKGFHQLYVGDYYDFVLNFYD